MSASKQREPSNAYSLRKRQRREVPAPSVRKERSKTDDKNVEALFELTLAEEPFRPVIFGKWCFVCSGSQAFFTCGQKDCRKSYHMKCVYFPDPYPRPEFNVPADRLVAAIEHGEEACLVKCVECCVKETTRVTSLLDVPIEKLAPGIHLVALEIYKEYSGDGYDQLVSGSQALSLKKIKRKAERHEYLTYEAFIGDMKQFIFDVRQQRGESSEEFAVAEHIGVVAGEELSVMALCVECYTRRFDDVGDLLPTRKLHSVARVLCETPHPLVWVKEPGFPYWPAKLLDVNVDGSKTLLSILYFRGDKLFHVNGTNVLLYSKKPPAHGGNSRHDAMTDAKKYAVQLDHKFGGMNVFEEPGPFRFHTLQDVVRHVFPNFTQARPSVEQRQPTRKKANDFQLELSRNISY